MMAQDASYALITKVYELATCRALGCRMYVRFVFKPPRRVSDIPVILGYHLTHAPLTEQGFWQGAVSPFLTPEKVAALNDTKNDCASLVAALKADHDALAAGRLPFDHQCACDVCDPSLIPTGERQGEHHIGIRFDNGREGERFIRIHLEGWPESSVGGAYEALTGRDGAVWRYRGIPSTSGYTRHVCETCKAAIPHDTPPEAREGLVGVCREIVHGVVSYTLEGEGAEVIRGSVG